MNFYDYYRPWIGELIFSVSFALLAVFLIVAVIMFACYRNNVRKMLISLSVVSAVYLIGTVALTALCNPFMLGVSVFPIIMVSALSIALSEKSYAAKVGFGISVPCVLFSFVMLALNIAAEGVYISVILLIILIGEIIALAVAAVVKLTRNAKNNMVIANHTVVVSNEDATTIDKTEQQKIANENVYNYAPDYAVEDDISVRAVSSADGEAKYIPQSSNKSNSSNKSVKSSKIQLAIVWLVPNVITYLGVILFATTMFTPLLIVIAIGVLGSVVGAYIIGNCITGLFKIKPPQKAILNLKVGNSKLKAAMSRKASSDTAMQTRRLTIMLLTVIWLVPVAVAGWLLFILYCNKKFMGKLLTMAQDCDSADSIVATRQGALYDIAYYFYRMIDYAFVYIDIDERKSAKEMIDRAENLLDVWTILYPDL